MTSIEGLAHSLQRNPEGLLLLGAGVALLMRNSASNGMPAKRRARSGNHADEDDVSRTVKSRVASTAEDIREQVSAVAENLSDKASELGRAASQRSRRAGRKARRSVGDLVETHPVAVALGGLAAGCLVAALFPATRMEQNALAPIGRMAEQAVGRATAEAKRQVAEVTARAGEQIASAVAGRILEVRGNQRADETGR